MQFNVMTSTTDVHVTLPVVSAVKIGQNVLVAMMDSNNNYQHTRTHSG